MEYILGNYKIIITDNKGSLFKNDQHIISLNNCQNIDTFIDFILDKKLIRNFFKDDKI